MIKIDEDLIKKVSSLSKLELSEEETKGFTNDFREILSAFKVLDDVDVSGVKSSFRPIEERNVLRQDVIRPSLSQKEALIFTKNKEEGFFVGPRTVE